MLSFQKLDYQRAIEFLSLSRHIRTRLPRGHADELVDPADYEKGIELLERIVAMLTRLIDP